MSLDERIRSLTLVADRVDVGDVEAALRDVRARGRKPSRRPFLITAVALAAAVAIIVGVTVTRTGEPDANVATTPGAGPWQSLLESTPDLDTGFTIYDFDRLADQLDVPVPGPDAPDDEVLAYRDAIWGLRDFPVRLHLPLNTATPEEVRRELGFDHRNVRRAITFGDPTGGATDVLDGRFDAATIEAAVRSDEQWSQQLTTPTHAGTRYYSWAGDQQSTQDRTPLRPLGEGGRYLVEPPNVVWALTTASMTAAIDARNGSARRTSDDRTVAAVVDRLDRRNSATATIMTASGGFDPEVRLIGFGYRRSGGQWIVEIAFAYSSEAAATDGERTLRERLDRPDARTGRILKETLRPIEIGTDGSLVVGSFTYTDSGVTIGDSVGSRGAMASLMPITIPPDGRPPTSRPGNP